MPVLASPLQRTRVPCLSLAGCALAFRSSSSCGPQGARLSEGHQRLESPVQGPGHLGAGKVARGLQRGHSTVHATDGEAQSRQTHTPPSWPLFSLLKMLFPFGHLVFLAVKDPRLTALFVLAPKCSLYVRDPCPYHVCSCIPAISSDCTEIPMGRSPNQATASSPGEARPQAPLPLASGRLMGGPSLGLTWFLLEPMAASPTQFTRSPRLSGGGQGRRTVRVCAQLAGEWGVTGGG